MNLGPVRRMCRSASVLDGPERGATAIEYGLLVALIAAVVIVAVITLGINVKTWFESAQWW